MSFTLLRNLGLGALVMLLLVEVFLEQRARDSDLQTLQDIVGIQLPVHTAVVTTRLHLIAAQHYFDRYDQRDRTAARDIEEPLRALQHALSTLDIPGSAGLESRHRQLMAVWAGYLEEEAIDPVGDAALELEHGVREGIAGLVSEVALLSTMDVAIATLEVLQRVRSIADRIEANVLTYLQRRRYRSEPILDQLRAATAILSAIDRPSLSVSMRADLDTLQRGIDSARAQLYAYLEDESGEFTSDSFYVTRTLAYQGWEELERVVREVVARVEGELGAGQQALVEASLAQQYRHRVIALFTVLVAIMVSLGLGHALTYRLRQLAGAANRFGRGDLAYRIPLRHPDEFGVLASTLNRMAMQLQQHTAALEESRHAAQAASQAKSQFLAKMSHEIRTPMNGVLGMAELLGMEDLSATQRRKVDTIMSSGRVLMRVIDDILDFSRIEAGRLELEAKPFDLRGVLDDVRRLLASQATAKGLELVVQLAPDIPSRRIGDASRLSQILLNLIGNAIKFTEQGRVQIAVAAPAGRADEVIIEVRDTGIGIPPDILTGLFQPFQQADNSIARRFGGSGLGLVISAQLAAMMDGEIGVESVPGQGSVFRIRVCLPVTPAADD